MSGEVLYRKWRPQTFHEVVGQETVTTTLRNAVRGQRVGHAYLFSGPRGTGKTSTGRILAKAVNCLDPQEGEPCNTCEACVSITESRCLDVVEIDAASNRGIDDIRNLRERVGYAAGTVRRKVYIIDEVHMLTDAASNALLKTLEEPPPHVMFVLATTELHKVLPTIVSRCQSFNFRRLGLAAVVDKLARVAGREGVTANEDSLMLVSRAASGSLRDAENMLQQLVASHGLVLSPDEVKAALGVADRALVVQLVSHLASQNVEQSLRTINAAHQGGIDLRHFGREVVALLRALLLMRSGCVDLVEAGDEEKTVLQSIARQVDSAFLVRSIRLFSEASNRDLAQQSLALELASVDSILRPAALARATEQSEDAVSPEAGKQGTTHRQAKPRPSVESNTPRAVPRTKTSVVPQPAASTPAEVPHATVPAGSVNAEQDAALAAASTRESDADSQSQDQAVEQEQFPDDGSELGTVRRRWSEFVQSLRGLGARGSLDAVLRSACEPVSLDDDVLVLRFLHEFHKRKVEDEKAVQLIEERLQSFYGRSYKVACVLEQQLPSAGPDGSQKAESLADAARRMGARDRSK